MRLVYAKRIGAPTLNAILPPMYTNYREQSTLKSLMEYRNKLLECKNKLLECKNKLLEKENQLRQMSLQRTQRELPDTSGN